MLGFAKYAQPQLTKKWDWDKATHPARKSSSLGFAAKYAAQLMDEILTPIPIALCPVSTCFSSDIQQLSDWPQR
jgi:hypothetical protein